MINKSSAELSVRFGRQHYISNCNCSMDNLSMTHGELLTLLTHNFGKISFPKKEDNKEIYSLI